VAYNESRTAEESTRTSRRRCADDFKLFDMLLRMVERWSISPIPLAILMVSLLLKTSSINFFSIFPNL
jgi:hypothetical protein